MIHHGDCLEVMAGFEPESVDAIVTDPPYGLEFMGKEWDKLKLWGDVGKGKSAHALATGRPSGRRGFDGYGVTPSYQAGVPAQQFHFAWAEAAYRVAKPSAYLLAFGGTRTVHRMTVALEDAGWIIRDMLVWAYASGFPKSKASLKPAWEPIVMARKPGPLRELAIDACRIGVEGGTKAVNFVKKPDGRLERWDEQYRGARNEIEALGSGRWPANVILTDPIFDGGWDGVVGGGTSEGFSGGGTNGAGFRSEYVGGEDKGWTKQAPLYFGDTGTYSRFFLVPKADRADREPVLGGLPEKLREGTYRSVQDGRPHTPDGYVYDRHARQNHHPTVKPTDLMRHLVRLVTPTGGIVLDPFLGSGSTGIAAEMEGFAWIGIEKEAEYVAIAKARLNGVQMGLAL